ncbi:molybdopterin biosynthesis protein MoeB [Rubripirellula tenax]|uniref:Molybdopterin biosynthesis protein MoeB n=1 Tax=Rubripirellula tenax TaxID=2528015 RepID=A0A5C6E1Z6_9BACT|nr:rhodanese-like domain-containing protein [Rubripirellula tenax]TWU42920.1 molybdopterin biosynthesis protein MoeB [Rubripirellula tenax]
MNLRVLLNLIAAVAVTLASTSLVAAQLGGSFGGVKIETIETDQLEKMLSDRNTVVTAAEQLGQPIPDSDFVVVDVRSEKEVRVSIIPGAITKAQFEKELAKYRGKLVIPYCTVGGRSNAYATQLAGKGVNVKNYQGSILKWIEAGLPLVTIEGEPTNRVHTHSDRYSVPAKYEQVTQ